MEKLSRESWSPKSAFTPKPTGKPHFCSTNCLKRDLPEGKRAQESCSSLRQDPKTAFSELVSQEWAHSQVHRLTVSQTHRSDKVQSETAIPTNIRDNQGKNQDQESKQQKPRHHRIIRTQFSHCSKSWIPKHSRKAKLRFKIT